MLSLQKKFADPSLKLLKKTYFLLFSEFVCFLPQDSIFKIVISGIPRGMACKKNHSLKVLRERKIVSLKNFVYTLPEKSIVYEPLI